MGFLNTLTEIEQGELKILATGNPLIMKLCNELKIYEGDPTKEFYSALKKGISKLTEDIHKESLDADNAFTKSIIKLAESGNKIFDTLKRGNEDTGGEKIEDTSKKKSADTGSILDRMADKDKDNL